MIITFQQQMPRCSLIRQMKGLDESFHLQYQRLSADNQSKIRYTLRYTVSAFFKKKIVTSDFFFLFRILAASAWCCIWKQAIRPFICCVNDLQPITSWPAGFFSKIFCYGPCPLSLILPSQMVWPAAACYCFSLDYRKMVVDTANESQVAGLSFAVLDPEMVILIL